MRRLCSVLIGRWMFCFCTGEGKLRFVFCCPTPALLHGGGSCSDSTAMLAGFSRHCSAPVAHEEVEGFFVGVAFPTGEGAVRRGIALLFLHHWREI